MTGKGNEKTIRFYMTEVMERRTTESSYNVNVIVT